MSEPESWLPNLVGGVSIWKLAPDLNDPKFMDGRLLEPETEGSDSLPARVTWDLTGLLPLPEARENHPEQLQQGIADFFACLENVSQQFADEASGYHKFKEAFTVPGLEADEGAHYFFDPKTSKLYVINWGATPRSIKQEQAYLFGYGSFGDLFEQEGLAPGAAAGLAGAGAAGAAGSADAASAVDADEAPADGKSEDKKKDDEDEEKKDGEAKEGWPWWVWLLIALAGIVLAVIVLLLLQRCDDGVSGQSDAGAGGAAAAADGASDAGEAGDAAADADADVSDAADGAADAASDAADDAEAGAGGGDAGSGDGGSGGAAPTPAVGVVPGSGSSCGGTVVVVGKGSGKGKPKVGSEQSHRAHYHPKAIAWRVLKGHEQVDLAVMDKKTYHVLLKPGGSFERIRVQWQDRNGAWHDH